MIVHFMQFGIVACLMDGPPAVWPEGHKWTSAVSEITCPACLEGMKWGEPTFEILDEPKAVGGKAIKCRRCGSVSNHPDDVEQHYCGRCCASHDDIWPPARKAWVEEGQKKRHDREKHLESLETALVAAIARLEYCASIFRCYQEIHEKKNPPERGKALANRRIAEQTEHLLELIKKEIQP